MTRGLRGRPALPPVLLSLALGACAAEAHWWAPEETPGRFVGVSVEVGGRPAPLFTARDGSDRWYLEARTGAAYSIVLSNRTGERLGVALDVDGLNVISGERASRRMYVLGPWESTTVRGWRTSLENVRRFTFVDERASYAARSGQANSKMGWIEAAVYRERRHRVRPLPRPTPWPWVDEPAPRGHERDDEASGEAGGETGGETGGHAEARPAEPPASAPEAADESARSGAMGDLRRRSEPGRSFPGTGWGPRAEDRAVVVSFEPERAPADRVTLRYEYRGALQALGVLPPSWPPRDRLRERDRGEDGFAKAP